MERSFSCSLFPRGGEFADYTDGILSRVPHHCDEASCASCPTVKKGIITKKRSRVLLDQKKDHSRKSDSDIGEAEKNCTISESASYLPILNHSLYRNTEADWKQRTYQRLPLWSSSSSCVVASKCLSSQYLAHLARGSFHAIRYVGLVLRFLKAPEKSVTLPLPAGIIILYSSKPQFTPTITKATPSNYNPIWHRYLLHRIPLPAAVLPL